ncbi:MAG: DUF2240 family protein [Candidatus Thalassarchaeaceae archaeon]|nr:DUF2240 family protein [Candidatus Thalassarchaeaceae archaeon]
MSSEVEIEISKLLHSSFNGGAGEPIGSRDLARMWSLEMQWFSPEVAQSLVERLHASGWLVGEADSLSPCVSSFEHFPELGWRPFLSRVGEIPKPPIRSSEKIVSPPENPAPATLDAQPHSEEGSRSKLASRIAAMSGLEKREVIRRAQRKRRALGPVSLDVAMLLLAREQNLEMGQLVEIP